MSVARLGKSWAVRDPDRLAVVDYRLSDRRSFGSMHDRADSIAGWLTGIGFGESDWATLLSRNRVEFFEVFLGVAQAGGALYPVNWRLSTDALVATVGSLSLRVIFVEEEFLETAMEIAEAAARETMHIVVLPERPTRTSQSPRTHSPGLSTKVQLVDYERVCEHSGLPTVLKGAASGPVLAVHTGGTTGVVKGAIHSHAGLLAAFINNNAVERIVASDRYLVMGQLFHSAAILALNYVMRGARVVLFDYSPERALDVILEERVTATLVFPSMIRSIVDLAHAGEGLSRLRSMQYGGGGFSEADIKRMYDFNPEALFECYGTSESVGVTFLRSEEHAQAIKSGEMELLRSCGREALLTEVSLKDEEGIDIPRSSDAVGEIHVRSGSNLMRYVGRDQVFGAECWIPTGDLAYRRSDGNLVIAGRSKDVIRCGGESLYPRQIENVISGLHGVQDVVVIGLPDEHWGEIPIAMVIPNEDSKSSTPSLSAVQGVVRQALGSYQKPHRLIICDSFPVSAAGKVERSKLAAMAEVDGDSGDGVKD